MRHRNSGAILDRKAGPRLALIRGLVTSIVLHEKIDTTAARAKAVRPILERLVTKARTGTLADRREVARSLLTEGAVRKMMEVVGPRYAGRNGGYLRITKLGARKGDAASMVQISFV
jgi:large subunit ribosomal protein L17